MPRKRRKVEEGAHDREQAWATFLKDVEEFEVQHVHGKGKFAFGFVEGPLIKALRSGDWYVFVSLLQKQSV
jgi:midasin